MNKSKPAVVTSKPKARKPDLPKPKFGQRVLTEQQKRIIAARAGKQINGRSNSVSSKIAARGSRLTETKIKTDYVCHCPGPILLSAPHSAWFVQHNGGGRLKTQRNHRVESFTSTMCFQIANAINNLLGSEEMASVLVWQAPNIKKQNYNDLDPNYLDDSELPHSPFH